MEAALKKSGRTMSPRFKEQVIYYNADHVHVFGPDQDVPWSRHSEWIDYELEWACVIGKPGVDISRKAARDHIFGYTLFNDWSARDLQFPFMEAGFGPGAGKDFANSLGPCILIADAVPDPYALAMTARVNGETWSNGSTSTMYHRFEDAIEQLSRDRPLIAGEIIGSGTVLSGCGFELDRRLALGDVVELELEGVGICGIESSARAAPEPPKPQRLGGPSQSSGDPVFLDFSKCDQYQSLQGPPRGQGNAEPPAGRFAPMADTVIAPRGGEQAVVASIARFCPNAGPG